MDITNETPAPTPDDIGRVYLHGTTRVMLVNDMAVAVAGGHDVSVKPVDDPDNTGVWPVAEVDYRNLTATDERIHPAVAASYEVKPPTSFDRVADDIHAALRTYFGSSAIEVRRDAQTSVFGFQNDGVDYSLTVEVTR